MEDITLRTGGLPLMDEATPWPICERCARHMLFRAQLPLAVSGLAAHDDDRVLLVFECHGQVDGLFCDGGAVHLVRGTLAPRHPPAGRSWSSPPAVMPSEGGMLVPFDDGGLGAPRTSLPPLARLAATPDQGRLRGVLGGQAPGWRDAPLPCGCGRPTRTVLQLMETEPDHLPGVALGPAVVQVCLGCDTGRLVRAEPSQRPTLRPRARAARA
jgi:hypothetical protein